MKFKGTWILATFAIALGCYVYFIEIKKADKDAEQKTAEEKILDFDSAKVKSFTLKNAHGEFALEKGDDSKWKLTQPVTDVADDGTVTSMLSSLSSEKFDQVIDDGDLKNFGLDNPQETITLNFKEGAPKKVGVGSDGALPGKIYIFRESDKKILYGSSTLKSQLDKTVKDFREKKIFKKPKDDIQHIDINHGQVRLTKKDAGWVIDGKDQKADTDVMSTLLNAIDGFRANDFTEDTKKLGFDKPTLDLNLEGKDGAPLAHFVFSAKKDNNVYIKVDNGPTAYQVSSATSDAILKKSQDYRDKKLPFAFKKDDVTDIDAKNSLTEIHLMKKGGSWETTLQDPTKQVSQIQVTSFLDKVEGLKVADYLDGEKNVPYGLGHIILKDSKGEVLLDFAWGERSAKSQRSYRAKSSKYTGPITVDGNSIESIPIQTLVENKATPTPVASSSPAAPKPGATKNP